MNDDTEVEQVEEVEFEPRPERIKLFSASRALEQAQDLMRRGSAS